MQIGKYLNKIQSRHLIVVAIGICILIFLLNWASITVPEFDSVRLNYKASDIWIVDRYGQPLESLRIRNEKRSLGWVKWSEVSPAFKDLLIQVEDQRFFRHPGVDILAIGKAIWERLTNGTQRGASTLTMQLAGLLKKNTAGKQRNVLKKIDQIITAIKLDAQWTKEQILETYINLVSFRGELVGLRAATTGHFGKNPSGLVQEEAALLVALIRSPNSPIELVANRACRILKMNDCQEIHALAQKKFSRAYRVERTRRLLPVFTKLIIEKAETSNIIQTSLDFQIQALAIKTLQEQLRFLKQQNVHDGAVLVLETQTGRIAAYVANSGAGSASAVQVDGIQMYRQIGSTIKPFVYASAFDKKLLQATSLIEDSPADISISQGRVYHPKNYDHIFRGLVSVGDALGSSMNVPAVRALQLVGETTVLERLRNLGFKNLQHDEYYGPSLALGTIDASLWELTHGYRQFTVDNSVFSNSTRLSIFNILASPEYRRFTFGMDSLLSLPFPAAVKTGTSKDMRDNWCIGWTSQYTIGVWIGNFNGEPMWNVSGMSGAAPVWRTLMMALHPYSTQEPVLTFNKANTPLPRKTISRIKYPVSDMLVGIDPDIPTHLQKLPIEIENPKEGQMIFLNKKMLNKAAKTTLWSLQRGKHLLELKTTAGKIIDAVKFEIR